VLLTTAVPIAAKEQKAYRQTLAEKIGRDVRLRVQVDPALIGGATIQVGDHLVDGSIRTRLEELRRTLAG